MIYDYTFQIVMIGAGLIGGVSGLIGAFAVLRKQSLLGDCIAHSSLPGVILAFIIIGSKDLYILLLGGFISGSISTLIIMSITKNTRIKFDSALALVMSVFFGLGLVLLTYTQKLENSAQAGLSNFIYGQASALILYDIKLILIITIIVIVVIALFWKEFKLLSFDREYAKIIDLNTSKLDLCLTILLEIVIIIGLQTVGVILMSAMIITPVVGARQWVNSLLGLVVLSAVLGSVSAVLGVAISYMSIDIPTGAVIVVVSTIITFGCLMKRRGVNA